MSDHDSYSDSEGVGFRQPIECWLHRLRTATRTHRPPGAHTISSHRYASSAAPNACEIASKEQVSLAPSAGSFASEPTKQSTKVLQ